MADWAVKTNSLAMADWAVKTNFQLMVDWFKTNSLSITDWEFKTNSLLYIVGWAIKTNSLSLGQTSKPIADWRQKYVYLSASIPHQSARCRTL